MNAYAAQFVLQSVSDVSAIDQASHYDPAWFSPTPVRFPTGYLSGRVFAPDGQPGVKLVVNVVSTEDADLRFWASTDKEGQFKADVPPGNYVLGINLRTPPSARFPFPPTYYPGTTDLKAARKLTVADQQTLNGLDIRIPKRLPERRVPVKVTWPDGKPVGDANVWLAETGDRDAVVGSAVSHTRKDGTFDLIGFEGIGYIVHANIYVNPGHKPYCAEKKILKAEDAVPNPLVMVLTRAGDMCRADD